MARQRLKKKACVRIETGDFERGKSPWSQSLHLLESIQSGSDTDWFKVDSFFSTKNPPKTPSLAFHDSHDIHIAEQWITYKFESVSNL